jgi:hypothetical protein
MISSNTLPNFSGDVIMIIETYAFALDGVTTSVRLDSESPWRALYCSSNSANPPILSFESLDDLMIVVHR